jgi:hypothetical protein
MMITLALALALTADARGNVDISEQQLTQYVNGKVKYEQDYALPGLFDAHVKLSRMQVELARSAPKQADVQSFGNFSLTLPNKPTVDGTITANFTAIPRYAPAEGAIYFDQFKLKDYVLEPVALNQQFGPMMGYLLKGIEQRLAKQPAYRLDSKNADQAWLKSHVTSVELQPGLLRLKTRS